jgi:hypothetical protein
MNNMKSWGLGLLVLQGILLAIVLSLFNHKGPRAFRKDRPHRRLLSVHVCETAFHGACARRC